MCSAVVRRLALKRSRLPVAHLTRLLERLEFAKHATAEHERRGTGRPRWAQGSAPDRERGPADADPGKVGKSG